MTDREIFKRLCLRQEIPEQFKISKNQSYCVSDKCRHCNGKMTEDTFDINIGYWASVWHPVHKDCAKECRVEEAYECQKIDAGCNDCKFFQRGVIGGVKADTGLNAFFPKIKGQIGFCSKNNYQVEAFPVSYYGMPCFVHRKEIEI